MFVLNAVNSVANQYLAALRDVTIQNDRLRFRKNVERLGEILAYELSKSLHYHTHTISTPLAETSVEMIDEQPVLISILRAGLPLFQGVLNFFDEAPCGFVGAYRHHTTGDYEFDIQADYLAMPSLEGKRVVLIDPMLASGKSIIKTIETIKQHGSPSHIDILCLIAAPEGIEYVKTNITGSYDFWLGAIDEKLDEKAYIIPGLGDAGDLCFGTKV